MYHLRTAGKRCFEWGAKIARIWLHKGTIMTGNNYFHRVGMVAIFFKNSKKNKIRVPIKGSRTFFTRNGATVPNKMP